MSQENVEVVRRLNQALNSDREEALRAASNDALSPAAELRDLASAPDQADVLRGPDAIVATTTSPSGCRRAPGWRVAGKVRRRGLVLRASGLQHLADS